MASALPSTFILQSPITSTGATNGTAYAVDNTVFTTGVPDWSIFVEVTSLTANTPVRFSIQDSVDGTTWVSGPTFELVGRLGVQYPLRRTFKRADFPGLRFGVASAQMRVSLTLIQWLMPSISWWAGYSGVLSN